MPFTVVVQVVYSGFCGFSFSHIDWLICNQLDGLAKFQPELGQEDVEEMGKKEDSQMDTVNQSNKRKEGRKEGRKELMHACCMEARLCVRLDGY